MMDSTTVAGLVMARAEDDNPGIIFSGGQYSHRESVAMAAQRAAWLLAMRRPGPFHIAVLSDNSLDYPLWLEAAAMVGAAIVGANPTHRGEELARDLAHTQCQLLVVSEEYFPLVDGFYLGDALGVVERESERVFIPGSSDAADALRPFGDAHASDVVDQTITPSTLGYLLFTSGTSGAPKAVICSQGRLAGIAGVLPQMLGLDHNDVFYCAMPLFHSNALMANWGPSLAAGGALALPSTGKFSASGFLPDVREFGVTYFNYVGKPLSYILATPEQPDDADTTLTTCFGNEGAHDDVAKFGQRFGCVVSENYGSSEGGANVNRTPDTPPGALGRAPEGTVVLDPETGLECPPARFGPGGALLNAEECIGELVSRTGGATFEGYWQNTEAVNARVRDGLYWTGDLAYRDEAGFFYFAGRDFDWLRVDGENFAAAPIERILQRHPSILLAAVYAVPDEHVGDQVMAALEIVPGHDLDAQEFVEFLSVQEDLGTKWAPKYLRLTHDLPKTATSKVVKKALRAERWNSDETILWRPGKDLSYEALDHATIARLNEATASRVL